MVCIAMDAENVNTNKFYKLCQSLEGSSSCKFRKKIGEKSVGINFGGGRTALRDWFGVFT